MFNKILAINYIDNAIYFFFCVLCFLLPISNAAIGICFAFIFTLYLIKFILVIPDNSLFPKFFLDRLSLFVIIFIISIGLSVFVSGEYIKKSFDAWYSKWLEGVLIFYFSYFIFRKKTIKIILWVIALSTFLICINGIFQKINGTDFIRGYDLITVTWYNFSAIRSTFNHYNGFATFLATMFFIIFGLCIKNKRKISLIDIVCYLNLFLISYCIIYTYSRGGWLSFLFGFSVMTILFLFYNKNKKLFFISCICLFLFLTLLLSIAPLRERLFFIFRGGDTSRFSRWQITLSLFKESPFFGKGIGTFIEQLKDYPNLDANFGYQYAHNSYLQLLAEVGIIGFIPFLLILIAWLKNSLKIIKSQRDNFIFLGIFCGICAYLFHAFFDNQLFSLKLATLFWFLLGLSSSFSYKIDKETY